MVKKNSSKYSASYTAGSLLYSEFSALLEVLRDDNKQELLKREVFENRYLKLNSENSRIRVITEIKKRIKFIDEEFYVFYENQQEQERKLLLFYVILKAYPLVFTFHFDVTLENWRKGVTGLDPYYYKMRLDEISAGDPEVDSWSDSTKRKVITKYIDMLVKAGLTKGKELFSVTLSDQYWCFFIQHNEKWFLDACLLSSPTINRIIKICS